MCEAVITADLDLLLARIQQCEARDPRIAQELRRLAEQFAYQKLLNLFGPAAAEPRIAARLKPFPSPNKMPLVGASP
jgi:hypothetical protein